MYLVKMRLCWNRIVPYSNVTGVLITREETQRQTQIQTEIGVMLPKAKGHQGIPATRRSEGGGMAQIVPLSPEVGTNPANILIFSGFLA